MHVGLAMLTLVPGAMGGSETYARALLREFVAGNGPERVSVLLNPRALAAYRTRGGGPVELVERRAFRPGAGRPHARLRSPPACSPDVRSRAVCRPGSTSSTFPSPCRSRAHQAPGW